MFETHEETPGWRAGKSVAHCEVCFEEKMKSQQEGGACDSDGGDETARKRESSTNTSVPYSSSYSSESPECTKKRYLFENIEHIIETFDDCFGASCSILGRLSENLCYQRVNALLIK